ncbi:MAG: ribosome biogenesis GTPase Der [Fervidobacterium sp.]|uniref:ribosome biogenesis GTPase Der n=1 Tax=Fervidobacterium sp. TaxID=1871331 RepID=UPI00404921EE
MPLNRKEPKKQPEEKNELVESKFGKAPIVLIVGKSNVGKSTLFNKLIGKRKSIVADEQGTTRDAVTDRVLWYDKSFQLVDTCGIFEGKEDEIYERSRDATIKALEESALVLFIVDGKNGLSSEDHTIASILRKSGADVLLVANKTESEKYYQKVYPELFSLGFGEPFPVSAEQSKNLDELIESVISKLEEKGYDLTFAESNENLIRVTIAGKPNAGKSSLFNMIINEERALVTPIAGTTRDTIDEIVRIGDKNYLFVDTAGLRKKSKIEDFIERISTLRTIEAIEKSDVVVLVIDSTQGITRQDQRIAGLAEKNGKGLVVVFNKWDLVKHADKRIKDYMDMFKEKLYFVDFAPVIFTSAVNKVGYRELMKAINTAYVSLHKKVPTSAVNAAIQRMIAKPPHGLKLYYGLQVDIRPPTFLFFVNKLEVPESFQNAIRKTIREQIEPFVGAPIFLKFKERE